MPSVVCGPSGGIGGTDFLDVVPSGTSPGEIRISADRGGFVRSVQFLYVNADGAVIEQPYHGLPSDQAGTAGAISIGKKAYISRIEGRYGKYVDSLRVTAMRDEGGPAPRPDTKRFGGTGGSASFEYEAPPGYEIVGFCGRSHDVVDAIGVVFRPLAERGLVTGFSGLGQLFGHFKRAYPEGLPFEFPGVGEQIENVERPENPNSLPDNPHPENDPSPEQEPMKRSGGAIKPQ